MPKLRKTKYSAACQRVLNFTPEQFAAAVETDCKPVLLTDEENERLTQDEKIAAARHILDVWGEYVKLKKAEAAKK